MVSDKVDVVLGFPSQPHLIRTLEMMQGIISPDNTRAISACVYDGDIVDGDDFAVPYGV